jgi:hypothetical protein
MNYKKRVVLCLAVLAMVLAALPVAAETPAPVPVKVGIYINQVYGVSLKDNQFSADFWIWFRWKTPGLNPLKSFEVVGGIKNSQNDNDTVFSKATGEYYASTRVNATINKFWNISQFPLDNHVLDIVIEDSASATSALVYVPDTVNCGLDPAVQVPGWQIGSNNATAADHTYHTSYGDPALPPGNASVYSRFQFSVDIVRPGIGMFVKMFFTVFIATLIALMCLLIKPTDLDPRFGLGAGALFAAVASEMVIASTLPDTNTITLPDKLHIIAIFFIFISLFESIVSLRIFTKGQESLSKRLDKVSLGVFLGAYLVISGLMVIFR